MKIKSWKAEVSMLVSEGTDTTRQTFNVEGGSVNTDDLPDAVATRVGRTMRLISDKTEMQAKIEKLEAELAEAKKRVELMSEADEAVAEKTEPEQRQMPVTKPRRR